MELLEGWIKDYNTVAPHSGLGDEESVRIQEMERRRGNL